MKITLFPTTESEGFTASVKGDVITINGEDVDLSPLKEGYRILGAAVGNKFFVPTMYVQRVSGELDFTLFLQVEPGTDEKWRSPATPNVLVVKAGPVPIPDTSPPKEGLLEAVAPEPAEDLDDDRLE